MLFDDRVVRITGAGSRIGAEIARRFAAEGAQLAIHDLDGQGAGRNAEAIRATGGRAQTYVVDVSQAAAVREAAAKVADLGRIDVLVNDAGINIVKPALEFTDDDWNRVIGVNLTGVWNYCRSAGPHLVAAPSPLIWRRQGSGSMWSDPATSRRR